MIENNYLEVYFNEYCKTCIHKKKDDAEEPCNTCLENSYNLNSHKPIKWEDKTKC